MKFWQHKLDKWLLSSPELDEEENVHDSCGYPGRRGCGHCEDCQDWGDMEYHRKRDEELMRPKKLTIGDKK